MMDILKTYLPTNYAAYLLERHGGKTEAEWIAFLNDDARLGSGDRQIPFVLCSGKRYYDLWEVYLFISRRDVDFYFDQLAGASGADVGAASHPFARIGFDASNPKGVCFIELVIQDRKHGNLRLTPDEARSLSVHLWRQADTCDCQDYEASEYKDGNETGEDALNALLIEIDITDAHSVCETSKEAA